MTAVDADTGEEALLDRDSGVDLVDAVAASTAGGPAYRIGDRKLIDGGYRRNENADLAAGFERVLVLSPLGGRTLHPLAWRMQLSAQVEDLEAGGSRVETILPDRNSLEAFGDNMMNHSTRPASAQAGYDQGHELANHVAEFWR
jgi:NTE family protein